MNTKLTDKFESALVYATRLHADQKRKISGVPYISHLLSVAALVIEAGGTESEAMPSATSSPSETLARTTNAALLHDSIEDQGGKPTREHIRQRFGETVVAIIDGCTEWYTPPKPPWQERKTRYLDKLRHASPSVRLVSLADKLHNARSLLADWRQHGDFIWTEFNSGKDKTLWFYQSLVEVYQQTDTDWMTQELQQVVSQLCQKSTL